MSKFLPDLYYLQGVDGVIFKSPYSAIRWAVENGMEEKALTVGVVDLVYYPCTAATKMKTMEDIQDERKQVQSAVH